MGLIKAAFDPPNRGSWGNAAGEFCPPEGRICFVPICCLSCLMFGGLYHADVTLLMLQLFWWLFSMEAIRSFHLHQWQHSRFSPLISVLRSLYSIRIFLLLHSFHEDFLLNTCSSTPDFRRNGVTDFFLPLSMLPPWYPALPKLDRSCKIKTTLSSAGVPEGLPPKASCSQLFLWNVFSSERHLVLH